MIGREPAAAAGLQAALEAAAIMARDSALAVTVVYPRRAGVLTQARAAARQAGVEATADVRTNTICIRFAPRPGPSTAPTADDRSAS
jgi:hypothetical protein